MKNRNFTSIGFVCLFVISCIALEAKAGVSNQENAAKKILDTTGIQGGFIVHVGCEDGKLTAALRAGDSYLFQMVEVLVSKRLFQEILERIHRLKPVPIGYG